MNRRAVALCRRRRLAAAGAGCSSSTGTQLAAAGAGQGSFPLCVQRRFLEYWAIGVSGRTQPYARGEALDSVDNTKKVVTKTSGAAASLTGNQNNLAYDSNNIFSATAYSAAERDHFQPFLGLATHRADPVAKELAQTVSDLLVKLLAVPDGANQVQGRSTDGMLRVRELWWTRLLTDFPSLKTPCTAEFRTAWEIFFAQATQVAHDEAAVTALARPFLRKMMEEKFISYAMVWRFTERLADAVETIPSSPIPGGVTHADQIFVSRHEKRIMRVVLERVTKIMLDTIADEPWAHPDVTSPLHVDISQFRAWHEAGNW